MFKSLFNLYFFLKAKNYKPQSIDNLKNPKTFLVISNTALGDTILSTPAIKSLKKSFPNSKIIAIFKSTFASLFKECCEIDTIITYDGKYDTILSTVDKIKQYKPDVALILHSNIPQDIQLCVLSNIPFILKQYTTSHLKKYLSYLFPQKEQHTIEARLDIVRLIGATQIDTTLEISPMSNKNLLNKYKQFKGYIGFQIGAADKYKMWPIENFILLANRLKDKNILITGSQNEWSLAQQVVQKTSNVINMCGKCSIEELPYLITTLKLLVTNDTGTMHLAIAVKTPTISLFTVTSSKDIGPYQDFDIHKVIQKDASYLRKIPKKKRDDSGMKLIKVHEVENIILGASSAI